MYISLVGFLIFRIYLTKCSDIHSIKKFSFGFFFVAQLAFKTGKYFISDFKMNSQKEECVQVGL